MAIRKMEAKCSNCASTDLIRDLNTTNALTCRACGAVVEENPIVSEVQFHESSSGATTIQGSYVGADQKRVPTGGMGRNALDSREQTMGRARQSIKSLANALKISSSLSDSAVHWFTLALAYNFVQGRRSQIVHAACLYIACRKEKTHHMLIDFSSRIQVSVFAVGATFLRLVKALHIQNLPLADPSLFIQHFADKLNFGAARRKVVKDAVKLCQKMANDWIHEGRRPAGIAGACILLASRMNNIRRTHTELVAVSHVAEVTLQKRLNEFKRTNGANLTVSNFRKTEEFEPSLPPSLLNNRKKEANLAKIKERRLMADESLVGYDNSLQNVFRDGELSEVEINAELKRISDRAKARHDVESDANLTRQEFTYTSKDKHYTKNYVFHFPEITTESLLSKVSSDPTNFDDLDDSDLDAVLLTPDETIMKTRIWHGMNRDFLIEQEQKRLKEKADEVAGHGKPKKKKIKKSDDELVAESIENAYTGTLPSNVSSAALSVQQMIKKKSSKINYENVGKLMDGDYKLQDLV